MKKILLLIHIYFTIFVSGEQVGEVEDSSSEKYEPGYNPDSNSEPTFDENFHSRYPTFTYQENSFEDLTSRQDPLLIPPYPPYYSGPWNVQREEVSFSGVAGFNTARRDWPTNLPHLPNFGTIVPYPALNSRSLSSQGELPSSLSSSQDVIQRAQAL